MITFQLMNSLPKELAPSSLPRIARECRAIPGLKKKKHQLIGLSFVGPKRMEQLNRVYRKKNKPTDVLSFSSDTEAWIHPMKNKQTEEELGDIVICPAIARKNAKERAIDAQEELIRLIVHGVLHLAGYDHATEEEEAVMFRLQERIIDSVL